MANPPARRRRWAGRPIIAAERWPRSFDGHPRTGDVGRALDTDPRGSAPDLRAVAASAAVPGGASGAGVGHAGEDLLQNGASRRPVHKPNSAVPHTLQPRRRHPPHDHRNRRRPVGLVAGRRTDVRHRRTRIYMVKISYQQKPFRRSLMQTWGAGSLPARPT